MFPAIPDDGRILFYRRDRAEFEFLSNFFPAPIVLDGETWPTTEHYYQAQKSFVPAYRAEIRACATPGRAKRLSADPSRPRRSCAQSLFRTFPQWFRSDWEAVKLDVMRAAVHAKFTQISDLQQRLLATGDAEIIEDSRFDSFWGCGPNGRGLNWLGRILMDQRAALRA